MDIIKSRSNQYLKHARKVRCGGVGNEFFVEGKRLAEELVKSEMKVECVFATSEFSAEHPELFGRLGRLTTRVFTIGESLFSYLSETKTPQGIAAVCGRPADGLARIEYNLKQSKNGFVVLLHQINNPGNLGAILRSAEAFGAAGVIVTNGSTDSFSAAAVRGSMGSVFRIPVWAGPEFANAIEWARDKGIRTICADANASTPLSEINWDVGSLLVFGSEAHGLTDAERALVGEEFSVSISEQVESLNLAVAAAIAMYAATDPKKTG